MRNFAEGDFGSIQPAEAIEHSCALLVERCEIRADSSGAGRYRGESGLRRDIGVLSETGLLSIASDKNVVPPFGVMGEQSGAPNEFRAVRDGREIAPSETPGKVAGFPLRRGDVVSLRSSGGCGWGDPLNRDPEQVLADVRDGYLTRAAAKREFGVVVASGRLDEEGTHRSHGHCIAKGADVGAMMAELLGRANGHCGGKGGSMHIADLDLNMLGCNGLVSAGVPHAAGTGHSLRNDRPVRSEEAMASWKARDPLPALARRLHEHHGLPESETAAIDDEERGRVAAAVAAAEAAEEPGPEMLTAGVFCDDPWEETPPPRTEADENRILSYAGALNEAHHQAMAADDRILLFGEDVADGGGVFGVSTGLKERFGADRVRDTPISEQAIAGLGVGLALADARPIVEIQFMDILTLAADQIVNQAAKIRYMLGGRPRVPLVVRAPLGAGVKLAAQHSQSLETWFMHVPGLIVAAPSTPYDAKGMLMSALRNPNPVVFLEHKLLYFLSGPVPEEVYTLPLGVAEVRRERGGARPGDGRVPRARRSRRPGAQVPARALGRDAPAGAARAGAREPPADARHGRALRRPRCPEPPGAPGRATPHLAGAQGDGALHHPRHREGPAARDAHRGDDGGAERRDQGDHRHPAPDEAGPGGPRVRRDVRPGPGPHCGRDQQVARRPGGAGEGGVEAARAHFHRGARTPPAGEAEPAASRALASTRCRSSRSSSSGTSDCGCWTPCCFRPRSGSW